MKRFSLFLALLFSLMVFNPAIVRSELNNIFEVPDINIERSAGVGQSFFMYMVINMPPLPSTRYILTIVELSKDKIGLQYDEYVQDRMLSPWLIKADYSKRYDYSLEEKIIHFKNYEFKIISYQNGKILYKHIK